MMDLNYVECGGWAQFLQFHCCLEMLLVKRILCLGDSDLH